MLTKKKRKQNSTASGKTWRQTQGGNDPQKWVIIDWEEGPLLTKATKKF